MKELIEIEKKIKVLKEEIPNTIYYEMYDKSKVKFSSEMLKDSLDMLENKKKYIEKNNLNIEESLKNVEYSLNINTCKKDLAEKWLDRYNIANFEDKKALLSLVVSKIYVYKDSIVPEININYNRFKLFNL